MSGHDSNLTVNPRAVSTWRPPRRPSLEADLEVRKHRVEPGCPLLAGQHGPYAGPGAGGDDVTCDQVGRAGLCLQFNGKASQRVHRAVKHVGASPYFYEIAIPVQPCSHTGECQMELIGVSCQTWNRHWVPNKQPSMQAA